MHCITRDQDTFFGRPLRFLYIELQNLYSIYTENRNTSQWITTGRGRGVLLIGILGTELYFKLYKSFWKNDMGERGRETHCAIKN